MAPQEQCHPRDRITLEHDYSTASPCLTACPHSGSRPLDRVRSPLSRCGPGTGSPLTVSQPAAEPSARLAPAPPLPHAYHPQTPDSLHCRVKQVELATALIAGPDAGVPPQPLHGHRIALFKSGHFVGVLAHDQAGVELEGQTELVRRPPDNPASPLPPLSPLPHFYPRAQWSPTHPCTFSLPLPPVMYSVIHSCIYPQRKHGGKAPTPL